MPSRPPSAQSNLQPDTTSDALATHCARRFPVWAELWDVPDLLGQVTVLISNRLRTTLGRCRPQACEIRIAAFVLEAPEPLLDEVLCHEFAHLAAFARSGSKIRAHGPEWRALMRAAGYAARPRLAARELEGLPAARRARVVWEHQCPVCQATRAAGRPVAAWRCSACRNAGLSGNLTITRRSSPTSTV